MRDLPLHVPQFPRQQLTATQFRQCLARDFRFRRAAREQLRVKVIQVLRQLFDDGGLTRRRQLQGFQPPLDFRFPVRYG